MRATWWIGLAVLLLLLGTPAATADDGEAPAASGGSKAVEAALEALKLRIEARIKEGELLAKVGRTEEALEAYRSVGQLYDRGMEQVRRLLAGVSAAAAPAAKAPVLKDKPFGGGAFAGRAGRRDARPPRKAAAAVERGLAWLAAHQSPSGKWGALDFANWCNGKPVGGDTFRPADGAGKAVNDVGVSGLALLAFLGAGHTHQGKRPYAQVVAKGLRYLKTVQDPEGCIGTRSSQQFVYGHAVAALALIEAYAMTRSPLLKEPAQKALDFIAAARNPYFAWRYGVKPGDNDTSITTWMVACLRSATLSNQADLQAGRAATLRVDTAGFAGARAWLEKMTDPDHGRVGYVQRGTGPARPQDMMDRFPSEKSEAMTAAGIFTRVMLGEDPGKSAPIRKGAALCSKLPPVWNTDDGSIDMYYWYYGTLAMYQVGGTHWRKWNAALEKAVIPMQRRDRDVCSVKGSWDPIGPWGLYGGRVYSTAMMVLCLEVSSRYDHVFGTK